jgi:hypothetical protein
MRVRGELEYLVAAEYADLIGKTTNAVYLMNHRGVGPRPYEVNGRLLWKKSEVVKWVEGDGHSDPSKRRQHKVSDAGHVSEVPSDAAVDTARKVVRRGKTSIPTG